MANKRVGKRTVKLQNNPTIISAASVVGPKEGQGPLKEYFNLILQDDLYGEKSWELAESKMVQTAMHMAAQKAGKKLEDINYLIGGDLINQIVPSSFAARELGIPFFGIYGACSTMAEGMCLSAMLIDGGFADLILSGASSHYCTAERQFRFPLEYGCQRCPTCQWTVTGSGAMVLGRSGDYPKVTYVTTGLVKDYGIKDANNMGAAMAPAAVDTIYNHFKDTGRKPKDYDIIATGDLGKVGKEITTKLLLDYGYDISNNYIDCGDIIFDDERQKTDCGGSGCGCSAVVTCGYLYKKLMKREIKSILLVSTGALMSTTSSLQGESIPGIAHAVAIEF